MPQSTTPHVLVTGAGTTGLLIAQGLQKAGIPYTIFEAEEASTHRQRERGMSFHWSVPLLKQLLPPSLAGRLEEAFVVPALDFEQYPNNGMWMYHGVDGGIMEDVKVPGGEYENVVHINIVFRYPTAEQVRFVRTCHPVFSMMQGQDCFAIVAVQDVPNPEKAETWSFQLIMEWAGARDKNASNEQKHRGMKERGARLHDPFRSAVLWVPDEVEIVYNDLSVWVPERWDTHNGCTVLAGDAAHSIPPHRGHRLNHAIEDVWNFVEAVKIQSAGGRTQPELMEAHRDEVVERGAKETLMSKETA